ncbi:MAG TPA: HAD-IB family phosphatase, partial [Alphaproteobacteria bacterium]|nr:HAD-IB family phosphatase [Alphaproteobacteria bacterium]
MGYVATLVGPSEGSLNIGHIVAVQNAFNVHASPDWLAEGRAVDLPLNGRKPSPDKIRDVRSLCNAQGLALFVQDSANRRKSLLLADMESTVVAFEALDELAKKAGVGDRIAKITAKAMNGEMDFRTALEERVAALKGLPATQIEKARQLMMKKINPGAQNIVSTMKKNGALCVLVTGGFSCFAESLAESLD